MLRIETKKKLRKLAELAVKEFGEEVHNLSNFIGILESIAKKNLITIAPTTISSNVGYIQSIIRNLVEENTPQKAQEGEVLPKDNVVVINSSRGIKEIIVVYNDGSKESFHSTPKKELVEEPVIWLGLFNYVSDEVIEIRKGWKTGCNVKNTTSILKHFGTLDSFQEWCQQRIDQAAEPHFKSNVDTERDLFTLKRLIRSLERRKSTKLI